MALADLPPLLQASIISRSYFKGSFANSLHKASLMPKCDILSFLISSATLVGSRASNACEVPPSLINSSS